MEKYSSIITKINNYFKLCVASIESDMAKRIMYSVIPSAAQPEEIMGTKGVVDYKALDAAAEGRKDILKYGTKACINECSHYNPIHIEDYKERREFVYDLTDQLNKLANEKNYVEALKKCVEIFNDLDGWAISFGGKAWAKIAETLLKIAYLDKELLTISEYKKKGPYEKWKSVDKEIQIKKNIVMLLNVFDGLAHNTASVMGNLIRLEDDFVFHKDNSYGTFRFNGFEEFVKDLRLNYQKYIDFSELQNYADYSNYKKIFERDEENEITKEDEETFEKERKNNIRNYYNGLKNELNKVLNILEKVGNNYYLNKTKEFIKQINFELSQSNYIERVDRITRLMDAKELENAFDTYKEVKQSLVDSGDIHRFKDWTGKLERHPEYSISNKDAIDAEILFIRTLKSNMYALDILKRHLSKINNMIEYSSESKSQILDLLKSIMSDMSVITSELFFANAKEKIKQILNSKFKEETDKLTEIEFKINKIFKLINYMNNVRKVDDPFQFSQEVINLLNNVKEYVQEYISTYSNLKFKKDQQEI